MKYFMITEDVEQASKRDVVPLWEYDIDAPNAQSKLKYDALPDFEPVFSKLVISRVTDVLDDGAIGGRGLTVNRKLKDIFSRFKLDTHRFYPLETYWWKDPLERVDEEYYWFQVISTNYWDWINYQESDFYLAALFKKEKIKDLKIRSAIQLQRELAATLNTGNVVKYSKLVFTYDFPEYNFFYMHRLYHNIFNYPIVSERLKKEIEQNQIVAFEFKQVNIQYDE